MKKENYYKSVQEAENAIKAKKANLKSWIFIVALILFFVTAIILFSFKFFYAGASFIGVFLIAIFVFGFIQPKSITSIMCTIDEDKEAKKECAMVVGFKFISRVSVNGGEPITTYEVLLQMESKDEFRVAYSKNKVPTVEKYVCILTSSNLKKYANFYYDEHGEYIYQHLTN